jgi:hypothetical protein
LRTVTVRVADIPETANLREQAAVRFHFAAEQLNAALNISFAEPISAQEAELITRVTDELGPQVVERIRSESRALEPILLLRPVQTDGA